MAHQEAMNAALLVGCAYEIVALMSRGRYPTITRLLKTAGRKHPVGKLALWLWCGYVSWHFLEPMEV